MWIWPRRRRGPCPDAQRAREDLDQARAELEAARADADEVDRVVEQLTELTRRNHFGPMIQQALRGSRST